MVGGNGLFGRKKKSVGSSKLCLYLVETLDQRLNPFGMALSLGYEKKVHQRTNTSRFEIE